MGDYNRLSASAPRNEILYDEPEEQSLKHSRSNDEDEGEGGYNASNDNEKSLSPELLQEPTRKFFKSSKSLHSAISVAAGTVMMLFGYEQGVFGGIIVGEDFLEYFNDPSPGMQGFVTSVYDLGCFAGAILTIFVGEKLGRKRMLLLFTVIMGIGILMQTVSHTMSFLVWGRLIAGIGNGGNTATAPVWHVETSEAEAKGKAVVKEMAVNVLGFVLSNAITLAFSPLMTEAQWRFPLGIQLIFVAIILTMVPMLPESPRWLLARKREAEAKYVLRLLCERGDQAERDFQQIRVSVKEEQAKAAKASWKQLLRGGLATRRVLLGMMLQTAQQLSGVNVLCYYLPVVLHRSVGLEQITARIVATVNATCFFLTTTASVFYVDRVGRRPLLMVLAGGMGVAFMGVAIGVGIASPEHNGGGIAATVSIFLFFTAFSSGWVSVPWLYPAEVNSLQWRGKGAALATASDWITNWAVVQTTPPGIEHLKWGLYAIYAFLNLCFIPLVYYLVVETKGKSLEETDRWFENNKGWLVHKADHSWKGGEEMAMSSGAAGGVAYAGMGVGVGGGGSIGKEGVEEDREVMMKAFEESEDEGRFSGESGLGSDWDEAEAGLEDRKRLPRDGV